MKFYIFLSFLLLASMLMVACSPTGPGGAAAPTQVEKPAVLVTPTAGPSATPEGGKVLPPAASAALQLLAKGQGISVDKIQVVSAEKVQWPDSCLGYAQPGEMCSQVVTDGYKIVLSANGKQYEYHTNLDGSEVRSTEGNVQDTPAANVELPEAVKAAQQALAGQLQVTAEQVKVVKFEAVSWPNGCLGIEMPGKMCTQVITPGYRVQLEVAGKQYELHTNKDGSAALLATAALPQTANKVLVWEQTEGGVCSRAEIGLTGVAYGPCGGTLKETALQKGRSDELSTLLSTYQTFFSGTRAGTVQFNGQGQKQPTEAEMRSIAEWASLVNMEAQGGRGGAAWGLALAWHREGGIAGFCDDLGIYRNGWAEPSSCKAGNAQTSKPYRLSADELAKLYAYTDQFKNFEYGSKDPATTDAMKITLIFTGQGSQQPTADQQSQIADFAASIYTQAVR